MCPRLDEAMTTTPPEYNEQDHITAAELRDMGAKMPDDLPDCAWTLRSELVFGNDVTMGEVRQGDAESRVLRPQVSLTTGDFHWVNVNVTVDVPDESSS